MKVSWIAILLLAGAVGFAPVEGQTLPAGRTDHESFDTLMAKLDDARFAVREQATDQLAQADPSVLGLLVQRYRQEPRLESRLRLRYAIESVYYRNLMAGKVGFLGVTPLPLASVYDPQSGQTVAGMVIDAVVEGHAAARGGVLAKDIILDFDGQPVARFMSPPAGVKKADRQKAAKLRALPAGLSNPAIEAFTTDIKARKPGELVPLRVLRMGQGRAVRVSVVKPPEALANTGVLVPTMLSSGILAIPGFAAGGLAVAKLPPESWLSETGLLLNEVIVNINGQPVPLGANVDLLDQAFRVAPTHGGEVVLEVRPLLQVNLTVAVGARTPDLMNPADWADAQSSLAAWWRDELGEPSIRFRKPRAIYYTSIFAVSAPAPAAEVIP